MDKAIIEYHIPIQGGEFLEEVNKKYREMFGDKFEDYKSTDEHIDILIDKFLDAITEVGDAGGWYTGDDIKVKIELEYRPEDK